MISKEVIIDKIHEGFPCPELFIVEVVINLRKEIIISVDTFKGISIKECVDISRYLAHSLGEELDDYEVQVSSPGLDNGFKVMEQFRKNTGKNVEVLKKDGIKITGILSTVADDFIEIEEKIGPKKKEERKMHKIEFSAIKMTKEVIKINYK